jgi:hypothetical protein
VGSVPGLVGLPTVVLVLILTKDKSSDAKKAMTVVTGVLFAYAIE